MARTARKKESLVTKLPDYVQDEAVTEDADDATLANSVDPGPSPDVPVDLPSDAGEDAPEGTGINPLRDRVRAAISVPRGKGSVPTLSVYRENCGTTVHLERYFILDVDGDAYRKGWEIYKAEKGQDPVGYLDMVINILNMDFPRMYRAVSFVPLV